MAIPVFHDDQHGAAIVCAAAVTNALKLQDKHLEDIHLVTSGAGAAAIACVDLLVSLGLPEANVILTDIDGVVFEGRNSSMPDWMARYAQNTSMRTLQEALAGKDIFLGLSVPRVLEPEWLSSMNRAPLIMALANPEPEIRPEAVKAARPDAIVATGRSDYPNQVNNLLCFPFIFRGALNVGATDINSAMKHAAVDATARLATSRWGGDSNLRCDRIIPSPFDPRLLVEVSSAVAAAAVGSGNAKRPFSDIAEYRAPFERLSAKLRQLSSI